MYESDILHGNVNARFTVIMPSNVFSNFISLAVIDLPNSVDVFIVIKPPTISDKIETEINIIVNIPFRTDIALLSLSALYCE